LKDEEPKIIKQTISEGKFYYGEWSVKLNKEHGRGIMIIMNTGRYEGYWKNGLPNIRGKHTAANGDYYEGEFLNGKAHGYGVKIYNSGKRYEGYYKNSLPDGKGKLTYPVGYCLEGYFKKGKATGFGKEQFADGTKYEGQFYKDRRHGKGYPFIIYY
jgi:hypothetical protein